MFVIYNNKVGKELAKGEWKQLKTLKTCKIVDRKVGIKLDKKGIKYLSKVTLQRMEVFNISNQQVVWGN